MIPQGNALPTTAGAHAPGSLLDKRTRSVTAILTFVAVAFGWSWAFGFAGMQVNGHSALLGTVLMMLAGFGPSLAGLAVVFAFSTPQGRRDWLARSLNWRIGWHWFALAFAFPPAVMLLAISVHMLSGGPNPISVGADQVPILIVNFALVLVIGGPLGEEFGWRGYAAPALRSRMGWRGASLIIGLVWGVWHLPLFFLAGTPQYQMPIPVFLLNILAGAIAFGWLYERTQGSVLPSLILHTSLNAWAGILGIVPTPDAGRPYTLVTGLLVITALALVLFAKGPAARKASARVEGSKSC